MRRNVDEDVEKKLESSRSCQQHLENLRSSFREYILFSHNTGANDLNSKHDFKSASSKLKYGI